MKHQTSARLHSVYLLECRLGTYVGCTAHDPATQMRHHIRAARRTAPHRLQKLMRDLGSDAFSLRVVIQVQGREAALSAKRALIDQVFLSGTWLINQPVGPRPKACSTSSSSTVVKPS